MMGNWAGWGGFGMGAGWVFMIVFWSVVIFALVAAVRWAISSDSSRPGSRGNPALETLRQRYARGEIGRDEFEQKKRELSV